MIAPDLPVLVNMSVFSLAMFAKAVASDDGVFFTPKSLVKMLVNVLEPEQGVMLDPACGSGGMFVQTGDFVNASGMNANTQMTFYGQEKVEYNAQVCLMNMAVHGLNVFHVSVENVCAMCLWALLGGKRAGFSRNFGAFLRNSADFFLTGARCAVYNFIRVFCVFSMQRHGPCIFFQEETIVWELWFSVLFLWISRGILCRLIFRAGAMRAGWIRCMAA